MRFSYIKKRLITLVAALSILVMSPQAFSSEKMSISVKEAMKAWTAQINEIATLRYYYQDGVAIRRGKEIYDKSCVACHGPNGKSVTPIYPRLDGQSSEYIRGQLTAFKNDIRVSGNSLIMAPFAKQLSYQDVWDVAYYLRFSTSAYLKQPQAPKGFKLPDTGQTTLYTDTFGQDGNYSIHPQKFTLNSDKTVTTDANTKLMWQTKGQPSMSMVNGNNYCQNLELGGYDDWRLPIIKELQTVVNYRNTQPAIDTRYFTNTPIGPSGFWAGPLISETIDTGWHIGFPDGHVMAYSAHAKKYIRCVRADDNAVYLYNELKDNQNKTITDLTTSLTWQQTSDMKKMNWEKAINHCESLNLAGQDNWRLPNYVELISLVDYTKYSPSINQTLFPDTKIDLYYWTSTSDALDGAKNIGSDFFENPQRFETKAAGVKLTSALAWGVSFLEGGAWRYMKGNEYYVRCVSGNN